MHLRVRYGIGLLSNLLRRRLLLSGIEMRHDRERCSVCWKLNRFGVVRRIGKDRLA